MPVMVGQVYTSAIDVVGTDGNPATPATAGLTITQVGGSQPVTNVSITPTSSHLSYDFVMPAEGLWRFDWATTTPGTPQTDYVTCRAYLAAVSLREAREYVGVQDTRKDRILQLLISSATRLAEQVVGTIVPRTFTDDWIGGALGASKPVIQCPHGPLTSNSAVTQIKSAQPSGPVWAGADLIQNPAAATCYPRNYIPFWLGPWLATYQAGRLVPSDNITSGVLEIVWDLWGTQRWTTGDSDYPDLAELASFEQQIGAEYRMPGRAAELLEGERFYAFG